MSRSTIARTLGEHWVSDPNGGTATESWCNCTCGARITVPGGTRDEASRRGDEHQADALGEALLSDETIESAAEAVHHARGLDDYGAANDDERDEAESIARAALTAAIEGEQ